MPLSGIVERAPPGLLGFDCNVSVDAMAASEFVRAGFRFAVRYISRRVESRAHDLSVGEAESILAAGLALMPVQHVAAAGWVPDQTLGEMYGKAAASNCRSLDLSEGITVWLDLEGVAAGVPASEVIRYCNSWCDEVVAAGYSPGIYLGENAGLGSEHFAELAARHYWKSGHPVAHAPGRGFQMVQEIVEGEAIAGIAIDRNITRADALGGSAFWLRRT